MRFTGLAVAMLAGLGPASAPAQETDVVHDCTVVRGGDFGSISVNSSVAAADGRSRHYRMSWNTPWAARGVSLALIWQGPALVPPPDATPALIRVVTGRRGTHMARLELGRGPGAGSPYQLGLTTQFENQSDGVTGSLPWGELRRHMQGVPALFAMAIERRQGVVGQERIEAATLAAPGAAIEAVREELAAMERDFRNRCPVHVHDDAEDI
jgi:hypothetical protein